MTIRKIFSLIVTGLLPLTFIACGSEDGQEPSQPDAGLQAPAAGDIEIASDDISGTVTGPDGPEAGVWVIAETRDLGDALLQDRGHRRPGALPHPRPAPGRLRRLGARLRSGGFRQKPRPHRVSNLDLTAVPAPNAAAAAQYYPAGYWFSLLEVPAKSEFPGTGPAGNGISPNVKHQADYIRLITSGGCLGCHQLGNEATREIPALFGDSIPPLTPGSDASSPVRPAVS